MMREEVAELVQKALLHFDGTRYSLLAWCIMPNHVHVVVRPRPEHPLESILHSWKSYTSKEIGKLVGKTGMLWQPEYYDHLIRDEDDLIHAIEYVLNNPQAAGLKDWRWVGSRSTGVSPVESSHGRDAHAKELAEVERRAITTLRWATENRLSLLDIALDHLTLARVRLFRAILANPLPQSLLDLPHVAAAVNGLRAAGDMSYLPRGLLTASLYHFVRGEHDLARKCLAEAQQIAERGPMPLYLADVHLHRARMFKDKAELAKAAEIIRRVGYGRRYDELDDAEEAAKGW
jgi:REP element-mobilizing transposase RayT